MAIEVDFLYILIKVTRKETALSTEKNNGYQDAVEKGRVAGLRARTAARKFILVD